MKRLLLAALAAGAVTLCAQAQQFGDFGVGHAEWHHWYRTGENGGPIMRPDMPNISCCDDDCRPTKSKMVDGVWYAWLDGGWVKVPEAKIKHIKSPNGTAHACATRRTPTADPYIFCFIPPDLEG